MLRKDKHFICKIYKSDFVGCSDGPATWVDTLVDTRIANFFDDDPIDLLEVHIYFCRIVRDHGHAHGRYRVTTSVTRGKSVMSSYIIL